MTNLNSTSEAYSFSSTGKELLLPENLISKLPPASLISIQSYGDEQESNGTRYYVGPDREFANGTYIQYRCKNHSDTNSFMVFGKSFHPF